MSTPTTELGRGNSAWPDPISSFDKGLKLAPLDILGHLVALDGRGEATLRCERELVNLEELARLLDMPDKLVGALDARLLSAHDPHRHDRAALRHEPERVVGTLTPRLLPLDEEDIVGKLEHPLGDRLDRALVDPA